MNLEVHANDITANDEVHKFVRWRAELAMSPLREQVEAVNVFVSRQQDSASGKDVRCLVMVKSSTRPDVLVEHSHANLYVAIHRAVDEAGWTLADGFMREQQEYLHRQFEVISGEQAAASGNHLEPGRAA